MKKIFLNLGIIFFLLAGIVWARGSVVIDGYEHEKVKAIDFDGRTAPSVSSSGDGRMYYDTTANKLRVSENGGTYTNLIGGSGAFTQTVDGAYLADNASIVGYLSVDAYLTISGGTYIEGNTGIGNTSPSAKFNVLVSDATVYTGRDMGAFNFETHGVHVQNSDTTSGAYTGVKMAAGGSSRMTGYIGVVDEDGTGGSTGRLVLATREGGANVYEQLKIDNTGTVGIFKDLSVNEDLTVWRNLSVNDQITTSLLYATTLDFLGTGTMNGLDAVDATSESTLEAALDHDSLNEFVANEHIDWTSASTDLSTSGDGYFGGDLTCRGTLEVDSIRGSGTGAGTFHVDGDLSASGDCSIAKNLSVDGFITQDTTYADFPLDFDLSLSNGVGSTTDYLYGTFAPFDMVVDTVQIISHLTPSGTMTVAMYEEVTDITATDATCTSTNKLGTAVSVDTIIEAGNWFGFHLEANTDETDLTNNGVARIVYERRSE